MARKNIEIIRLTESDLHRIIENSVKTYLREEKVTEDIQYVIDVLKQNTRENIKDIKKIEQAMVQDSDIADIVYQLAFTDEKDNFVTINPNEIEGIDGDTYNIYHRK